MIDPVTSELLSKALDGLSLRQLYTAQNIANANTPNYQPISVNFETALKTAFDEGLSAISASEPHIRQTSADGAGALRLDLQLAEASQTALRYSALSDMLSRQMAISRTIATGGR